MNMEYSVVDIRISRNTLGIKRSDFGSILVIGSVAADGVDPKLKEYFSLAEVLVDYPDIAENDRSPEYIMASNIFGQEVSLNKILIGQRKYAEILTETYSRIKNLYQFYAVVVASDTPLDLMVLAGAIEASGVNGRPQILGALETDTGTLALTKAAHAAKLNRTFVCYNKLPIDDAPYMQGAWLGKMLPIEPGSANWSFKTLAGITADDAEDGLTSTKIAELIANKGNFYTKNGDRDVTFYGTMASGEYIDIIYGIDWLDHTMQQDLINLFNRTPKIDYTNGGISLIETAMRQSLDLAKDRRVIDSYTITVPNAADISFTDKANRELKQITFQAILTGAINKIVINGYVTL